MIETTCENLYQKKKALRKCRLLYQGVAKLVIIKNCFIKKLLAYDTKSFSHDFFSYIFLFIFCKFT